MRVQNISFQRWIPLSEIVTTGGIVGLLLYSIHAQQAFVRIELLVSAALSVLLIYTLDHYLDNHGEGSKRRLFFVGWCATAFVWILSLWALETVQQGLVLIPVVVGMLYHPRTLGLKKIPYLKSPLVSFVIALPVVYLPQTAIGPAFDRAPLFVLLWLIIFQNAVLFDSLDCQKDSAAGLKTFPLLLGIRNVKKWIAMLSALGLAILFFWTAASKGSWMPAITLGVPLLWHAALGALIDRNWTRGLWVCLIDGALLFPLLLAVGMR